LELIITSTLAFGATNIDDLFLLTLFFGNKKYRAFTIISGQLLGIGTLIAISVGGAFAGNFISQPAIGLLGLFPIYLAIRHFFDKGGSEENTPVKDRNKILGIAMVTIANGGDNVGVYIPLFATLTLFGKLTMIAIFFLMTLLWCIVAKYLANHPLLKTTLEKYGHVATPIVLILLGLYILYENQTLSLFF
jgi:cadmium resistance protein CadD (predicted permease)